MNTEKFVQLDKKFKEWMNARELRYFITILDLN